MRGSNDVTTKWVATTRGLKLGCIVWPDHFSLLLSVLTGPLCHRPGYCPQTLSTSISDTELATRMKMPPLSLIYIDPAVHGYRLGPNSTYQEGLQFCVWWSQAQRVKTDMEKTSMLTSMLTIVILKVVGKAQAPFRVYYLWLCMPRSHPRSVHSTSGEHLCPCPQNVCVLSVERTLVFCLSWTELNIPMRCEVSEFKGRCA